jgi:hypothetical protein
MSRIAVLGFIQKSIDAARLVNMLATSLVLPELQPNEGVPADPRELPLILR